MSRNRYGRDEDFYDRGQQRERGGEDRYGQERGGYARGGGHVEREFGYDDPYGARRGAGGGAGGRYYGRDDYGRAWADERADYRQDERRYGGYAGGGGERLRREEGRYYEDRPAYDEGRDYGRGRATERGRGASRSHVRCRDIMTRDVTVATRDTSLLDVAAMMRDEDTGVIPVVERQGAQATEGEGEGGNGRDGRAKGNGRLVGLITDRDIVIRAVAEGKDSRSTRAEEVMTTDIHTAQPNDRVIEVIRKMGDKQVRRIPVVDGGGNLQGIISMADVALETEEDRELADALEEISSGSSFWSKIFG